MGIVLQGQLPVLVTRQFFHRSLQGVERPMRLAAIGPGGELVEVVVFWVAKLCRVVLLHGGHGMTPSLCSISYGAYPRSVVG